MATYNGENYLAQQLESIVAQTYKNWKLYVQDDLSTDGTMNILKQFSAADDRIVIIDNKKKLGARNNFLSLLSAIDADYYMFADQDDVWLPNKIALSVSRMLSAEARRPGVPVVVHTDLTVVDARLEPINQSLWNVFKIQPALLKDINYLGTHCLVTGCTMLLNRAAREVTFPVPDEAVMHDYWIALRVIQSGGLIEDVPEQTMLYRQHGHNTLGIGDYTGNIIIKKIKHAPATVSNIMAYYKMARQVNYGSLAKFFFYKYAYYWKYHKAVKNQRTTNK